jgi:IS1 family transposase
MMVYRLSTEKRAQVLRTLCEGNGMRATGRICDVAQNSVLTLLEQAGQACAWMHDDLVQSVKAPQIQCDEIWAFCYAKEKNVAAAKAAPVGAGDVWCWTALCASSKMILSYHVGDRTSENAREFLGDLASRLSERPQISTDGLAAYAGAVFQTFEKLGVDYAQVDKIFAKAPGRTAEARYSPPACIGIRKTVRMGDPDPAHISTSLVERSNLTLRMTNRRYTRLTNSFSRKWQNHVHMLALGFAAYNFCKQHKAHKLSPAMAAGVTDKLWSFEDIVERIDYYLPHEPKPRGPYKKRVKSEENSN